MKRAGKGFLLRPILLLVGFLFLAPLVVTVAGSFFTEAEIESRYSSARSVFDLVDGVDRGFVRIPLIPSHATLEQYREVLVRQPAFLRLFANSLLLAVPVTAGGVLVAVCSAYGFTVWRWKHKEALFALYIIVMLLPLQAVLVPNYIVADLLGMRESYLAIILPGIFSPFGVFLLRQGMRALPAAYFEAAEMDGAGHWVMLTHIVLPQIKSSIAALCMLTFIEYWNLVEQVVIFITDYTREPLSVYLSRIAQGRMGLVFAASSVYLFLPLWFLLMGQRDLEKGIELSGVK